MIGGGIPGHRIAACLLALALCLPALPGGAQDAARGHGAMTPAACAASWAAFLDALDMPARFGKGAPEVSEAGWCRIDRATTSLDDGDFEILLWQGEGLEKAAQTGVPPANLEVLFLGVPPLDPLGIFPGMPTLSPEADARPRGTLHLAYVTDPASRSLVIEDVQLDYPGEGFFRGSARLSGIDISSAAAMQLSLGSTRLREARLVADLRGALAKTAWRGEGVFGVLGSAPYIAAIPAEAIDDESRRNLQRWANTPAQRDGRLEISAKADPGLGLVQMGAAVANAQASTNGAAHISQTMAILLSGVTLTTKWTPAE